MVLAVDAQRDARDLVPLGRADGEALDVEAAPREHARDAHQRARLVLDEDRQRVLHGRAPTDCAFSLGHLHDVERRGTRGDHREAVLARIDARVDDAGAAGGERFLQRGLELLVVLDREAEAAVRTRERGVVGQRLRQVDLREALVEEHVLPLSHHAEVAVVHDHDDDRQLLEHDGRELLRGHLEAAVAVDADDGRVGTRRLRADRGRNPVAHRPEAARA